MKFIDEQEIKDFFSLLNSAEINYVLIKNVGNELPCSLNDGKDIDILVHPSSKILFENVMNDNGFIKTVHPLGVENGWSFSYSMQICQFWIKRDRPFNLYIDVSFVLCCKSLTPKTWIPLIDSINDSIWECKEFDFENNWWIMDEKNMLFYLLVRSVFDKKNFSDVYIHEIDKRKNFLPDIEEKLNSAFFKYSSRLIELVTRSKYKEIVQDYVTFDNY